MCDAIVHRGPDDSGYFVAPEVALGMRRLSIIDVAGGQQPIGNEDGSIQVVFNGEIYNHHDLRRDLVTLGHRFHTKSDTETIVHLYEEMGADCVTRLRGMFAIALWDARTEQLVLARDRLGIKPLSYWLTPDGIAFCSELRSLLALSRFPGRLDERAIAAFLSLGYVPDPLAAFAGVAKLPPGHVLVWSATGGAETRRYWTPVVPETGAVDEAVAVERLRELLADAVGSHLESEVPLGAFLSGGLDSSTVVALMAQTASIKPRTFSIGFDDEAFNEAPHARRVAEALGTRHTDLVVRPDADRWIEGVVGIFDEPFADSSALPTYLVSGLARRHVTVSLSGDGGDELFGGYTRYLDALRRPDLPAWGRAILRAVGHALPHISPGRGRLLDRARSRQAAYAGTGIPCHGRSRLRVPNDVGGRRHVPPWRHPDQGGSGEHGCLPRGSRPAAGPCARRVRARAARAHQDSRRRRQAGFPPGNPRAGALQGFGAPQARVRGASRAVVSWAAAPSD